MTKSLTAIADAGDHADRRQVKIATAADLDIAIRRPRHSDISAPAGISRYTDRPHLVSEFQRMRR